MLTPPVFPDLLTEGDAAAWAVFSPTGRYRYLLGRSWSAGPLVLWLLTNPSQAGVKDDATVRVARSFSQRNGFGGMIFANLKAFVETHRRELEKAITAGRDVIGPENQRCLNWALLQTTAQVIVAWGAGGAALGLDQRMLRDLQGRGIEPYCLGVTKAGHPRHPLRLALTTPLVRHRWSGDSLVQPGTVI